ncbi:DUF3187 family protein [Gammaproteobacteria bacterium]|nr:DUF3187 family protein [Gammaproteobacteria bacterium]
MNPAKGVVCVWLSAVLGFNQAFADGGFATRDLNPILQPIYLPTLATFNPQNGWKIDHSVYITNTLQEESRGDESLIIDVENYRYELGIRYRQDKWLARLDLPFVSNSAGELDSAIDDWHRFFGLPQGKRNEFPRNEINIGYQRNGSVAYRQDSSSSGLADIALAVGYQADDRFAWFAGIELPSGDAADYSGNEAVDTALWLTYQNKVNEEMGTFALLGVSFPGDGGNLEGLVVDQIWVAQAGFDYRFKPSIVGSLQFDFHSQTIEHSELKAFGNSLQAQFGLGFLDLIGDHRFDFFFSEDIHVGSAPDISFGLRLSRAY